MDLTASQTRGLKAGIIMTVILSMSAGAQADSFFPAFATTAVVCAVAVTAVILVLRRLGSTDGRSGHDQP